jgi:prephenate dehydrogenase/chorismate mutase
MDALDDLRHELDQIDDLVLQLLNKRMLLAGKVAECKQELGMALRDQKREEEILARLKEKSEGIILKEWITKIYTPLLEAARCVRSFHAENVFPYKRVGIVGLGLIGGSIAKALKEKKPALSIAAYFGEKCDEVDKLCSSLDELIEHSELIFLCCPISAIIPTARIIKAVCGNKKLLVMDVASVKREITEEFAKLSNEKVQFVPSHPMAGCEKSGLKESLATLFVGAPWVVTAEDKRAEEIIAYLGASPLLMEAEQHDRAAALVSHLPYLIARRFFEFVQTENPASLRMAGPGFKSFTRLSCDNPQMRSEIAAHNQDLIASYLSRWMEGGVVCT